MLYHLFQYLLGGQTNYAYQSVLFRSTCAILLSFFAVLCFGPRTIRMLRRLHLDDTADFDHDRLNRMNVGKVGTPTMGGVLIIAAVAIAVLLLADLRSYYIRMGLFCLVWLGLLGGVDDYLKLTVGRRQGSRHGLKMYEKLLFQVGLAVLLGWFIYDHGHGNETAAVTALRGDVRETFEAYRILTVPFYKQAILLGAAAFSILTVLVMVGTSNAVNLTDGMDGLAAGCVAMCSFVFMVLAHLAGDYGLATFLLLPHVPFSGELAVLCGGMVGACLGFLWYNCHPAEVFMGDTGSLALGGLIGYVAIVIRQELMLLIVGGVFVIEAVSVMLQVAYFKFSGGKRIFRVAPIHHHFHMGGWTETQTVTRFWLLSAIFAAFALATIKLR